MAAPRRGTSARPSAHLLADRHSLSTAVNLAVWTSAAMVVLTEFAAGVRAGESGRDLALDTAVGALLGLMVVVLRYVLH